MKNLFFGLLATVLVSSAQASYVLNTVTLTLTLTYEGPEVVRETSTSYSATQNLLTKRLGNKQVLDAMVQLNLLPNILGYSIVEAYDDGESMGFFAYNSKTASAVKIPSTLLSTGDYFVGVSSLSYSARMTSRTTYSESGTAPFRGHARGLVTLGDEGSAVITGTARYNYTERSVSAGQEPVTTETYSESYVASVATEKFVEAETEEGPNYSEIVSGSFSSRAVLVLPTLPSGFFPVNP